MRTHRLAIAAVGSAIATLLLLPTSSARSEAGDPKGDCSNPASRDRDHDGTDSLQCGGTDCDDDDQERYRGNPEQCDGRLASGRAAANHDEDCDPATVSAATNANDGDADRDGFVSTACTNPWPSHADPGSYVDPHVIRSIKKLELTQGLDCDDSNFAVVPGAQVCDAEKSTLVCAPALGFRVLPTSSALADPGASKVKALPVNPKNNYASIACPAATACVSQPNGTGVCR